MFRDILGKIMFNTGRNYLKLVREARILYLDSRKCIPQKPELKTLPSKKITELCVFHIFNCDRLLTLNLHTVCLQFFNIQ